MPKAEAVRYQPQWFQNPRLIIGTLAIIFTIWLGLNLGLWRMITVILIIQIVLFCLVIRRPVWAMAALMVGQFTASGYMLSISGTQISARFLWAVLAIVILIPILKAKGGIHLGNKARNVIIPTVIFYCLAAVANSVNIDMTNTYQYLRTGVTALAIVFFLPAVVKNEKDLKLLTTVIFITCLVSALAAVMQHYRGLGLPVYTIGGGIRAGNRAPGLSEGSIYLAYELPVVILPMFALFLLKGVNPQTRKLLPVLMLVMLAALYFTYTRSGMYSLLPGMLVMIFLLKGRMRKTLFLIFLILGVGFLLYTNMTNNRYSQGFTNESSAAGRLVLWQAGAKIALDNPWFGIGQGRFTEISQLYSSDVEISAIPGAQGVLGMEEAHNDFIRVWVSFGTPALLAYLWIFIVIFRNFYYAYRRSPGLFHKGIALGGFTALAAYIVNAFTHNLMDSVPLLWILAGFSIALVKMAEAPKPVALTEGPVNVPAINPLPDASPPEP
jgi:O-antigen ligase